MPAVQIRKALWNDLLAAAEKRRQRPEALANRAVRDFLQHADDRELLSRSTAAARRAPLKLADTEAAIRRFRRKK